MRLQRQTAARASTRRVGSPPKTGDKRLPGHGVFGNCLCRVVFHGGAGFCTWEGPWGSGRGPGLVTCSSLPLRCPGRASLPGGGQLRLRGSDLQDSPPSPPLPIPAPSRRAAGLSPEPVPPWGCRHNRVPSGRTTEVRRMRCHGSYRMATIARETELAAALRWASPSGNFVGAGMVPNHPHLRARCAFPIPARHPGAPFPDAPPGRGGGVPGVQRRRFAFTEHL